MSITLAASQQLLAPIVMQQTSTSLPACWRLSRAFLRSMRTVKPGTRARSFIARQVAPFSSSPHALDSSSSVYNDLLRLNLSGHRNIDIFEDAVRNSPTVTLHESILDQLQADAEQKSKKLDERLNDLRREQNVKHENHVNAILELLGDMGWRLKQLERAAKPEGSKNSLKARLSTMNDKLDSKDSGSGTENIALPSSKDNAVKPPTTANGVVVSNISSSGQEQLRILPPADAKEEADASQENNAVKSNVLTTSQCLDKLKDGVKEVKATLGECRNAAEKCRKATEECRRTTKEEFDQTRKAFKNMLREFSKELENMFGEDPKAVNGKSDLEFNGWDLIGPLFYLGFSLIVICLIWEALDTLDDYTDFSGRIIRFMNSRAEVHRKNKARSWKEDQDAMDLETTTKDWEKGMERSVLAFERAIRKASEYRDNASPKAC